MVATCQLVIRSGPSAGTAYPIEKPEILVGRDLNNDIVINDPEISRRHSRLFVQGSNYMLEDLGSTNGTSVNGERLTGAYILRTGSLITLGEHITLLFDAIQNNSGAGEATAITEGVESAYPPTAPGGNYSGQAVPPQYSSPAPAPVVQQPAYQQPVQSPAYQQPAQSPAYQPAYSPAPAGYQAESYQPQAPAPGYAGQVPEPYQAAAPKKSGCPVWLIVILLIFLLMICVCGGVGWYIDSQNLYCQDPLKPIFDSLNMCR